MIAPVRTHIDWHPGTQAVGKQEALYKHPVVEF